MQQSEYMAMMQGDDGTLATAELVAAYEQGIEELRVRRGGDDDGAGARPARPRQVEHGGVRRPPRRHRDLLHRPDRADDCDGPPAADERRREAVHRAARLPVVRPRRATGPVHGPAAARRPHPAGAAARGVARTAVHSGSGLLTLRQLVLQAVRHLRHHLPFIAEKRAALGVG